jgi:hypothetical protein
LAVLFFALSGCGRVHLPPQLLQYQFHDHGPYRVDCSYHSEKHLAKKHDNKIFSETREGTYVKTSYRLQADPEPGGGWLVSYTLLRLRLHDQDGRFKMEIGPDGGEVFWYQEKQALEDYLGPDDFKAYQRLVRQPLARVHISARGVQAENGLEFNFALLHVLGKNRVYGDFLARGVKVPPVLLMIFKPSPVKAGEVWDYAGNSGNAATQYKLESLSASSAQLTCLSEFNLGAGELKAVRQALHVDETTGLELKQSRMVVTGSANFLLPAGRPGETSMNFDKAYAMTLPAEAWELQETERFDLTVEVAP